AAPHASARRDAGTAGRHHRVTRRPGAAPRCCRRRQTADRPSWVIIVVITLEDVLSRYWGYTSFRPLQRDAMDAILSRRDSLVVLPTGGGKSICFQAPALVGGGVGLVVSPLISLMKDQVDTLVANGIQAACYNSALSADAKTATAAGIREG